MAQTDTGLGWSAKSEWLLQLGNYQLAEIPGGTGLAELPTCMTLDQGWQSGLTVGMDGDRYVKMCIYQTDISPKKVYYARGNNGEKWIIGSTTGIPSDVVKIFWYTSWGRWDGGDSIRYWDTTTVDGVSYNYLSIAYGWTPDQTIPVFNSLTDAIRAMNLPGPTFTKTNAGFAVACVAKWKTDNNVLFTTPVLISSETGNTDMTCTDSTYNLAKLNMRYDGVQFYMSFFDVVNENIVSALEEADLSVFKLDLHQVFNLIAQSGMSNIQITETVDPYEDFGYTEEDAGEINPDPQDDDVDFDDLPTKSFATAGFCRIYNPDVSDLNDLASYMWTDQNFLQTVINHLKQILENPIEAIISLSMVPVQPPVGPSKVPVNVMFINTGVSMRPVTSQFVTIDCGTTVLQECYGGALDYNPYTRVQIYLPYIGTVQLDTDEVMAKTLHLQYHIDVVTGICCAEIKADNKLLYSFSGHCAVSQPITSADFSSYLNAAVAAAKVAVGVATGSAEVTASAAAAQAPPEVSGSTRGSQSLALVPSSSGHIGPHLGSPGGSRAWTDFSNIPEPSGVNNISWGELAKPGNINTVASAMGGKMVVQHSGGFSGNSGYLAKRRPYLIIIRPRIANPRNYAQHFGRTSMEYLNLGSCTGYTKVQSVHLSGFDATNPELSEISSLLKGGVLM